MIIVLTLIVIAVIAVGTFGVITWLNKNHSAESKTTGTDSKHSDNFATSDERQPVQTLSFKTILNTDKQGTCNLNMKDSSGKVVLTAKNSTIGKEGQTGCEDWKLDTSNLAPGDYEVVVTFTGDGETATSTTTIAVDPQQPAKE